MYTKYPKLSVPITESENTDTSEITLSVTYRGQTQVQTLPVPDVTSLLVFNKENINFYFIPLGEELDDNLLFVDLIKSI